MFNLLDPRENDNRCGKGAGEAGEAWAVETGERRNQFLAEKIIYD